MLPFFRKKGLHPPGSAGDATVALAGAGGTSLEQRVGDLPLETFFRDGLEIGRHLIWFLPFCNSSDTLEIVSDFSLGTVQVGTAGLPWKS